MTPATFRAATEGAKHMTDDQDEARAEFIAQAWNAAYEKAFPPSRAYDDAERAGRKAAADWDKARRGAR